MDQRLFRLTLGTQNYNWGRKGSSSQVARLLVASGQLGGDQVEEGRSYAELWLGTHPKTPSRLEEGPLLSSVLQARPQLLGQELVQEFGPCLPFLTKVLSIGHPLQLQVHPSMEEAAVLHRQNPAAFLDANHKPEMAVAITPFTALCGWRIPEAILRLAVKVPELGWVLGEEVVRLLAEQTRLELKVAACYSAIFQSGRSQEHTALLKTLATRLAQKQECIAEERVFLELHSAFPGDPGCWGVFLLNLLHLSPGEAIWVPAGQIHAYVSGDCVEVLSCGDNVLFCGLVHQEDSIHFPPALTDPSLLARVVSFLPSASPLVPETTDQEGHPSLAPPVREFRLTKLLTVEEGGAWVCRAAALPSASTLLVLEGEGELHSGGQSEAFRTGQGFLLGAEAPLVVTSKTSALIYRVTTAA